MSIAKLRGLGFRSIKTRMNRSSLRRQLLNQDDRTLEDMGFSQRLLKEGVRAWPWREETAETPAKRL